MSRRGKRRMASCRIFIVPGCTVISDSTSYGQLTWRGGGGGMFLNDLFNKTGHLVVEVI